MYQFIACLLLAAPGDAAEPPKKDEAKGHDLPAVQARDNELYIQPQFTQTSSRFGVVCTKLRDPVNPEAAKRLTRDERGITNNTVLRVGGYEYLFGHEIPGMRWVRENNKLLHDVTPAGKPADRAWRSVMQSEFHKVTIEQHIEVIAGDQSLLHDTMLVRYIVTNSDRQPHQFGLRVMLDTFIGANDGPPFLVPPTEKEREQLIDTLKVLEGKGVPAFLRVLESERLDDPLNTVAELGLRLRQHEAAGKVVLCRWPQNSEARWGGSGRAGDWKYEPINVNPKVRDSCVVLYWEEKELKPAEQRVIGFTYGLGKLAKGDADETIAKGDGRLLRLLAGGVGTKQPFTVTAYATAGKAGAKVEKIKLALPAGLTLADGEQLEREPAAPSAAGYAQVSWRVQAAKPGAYVIKATLDGVGTAEQRVVVHEQSRFE